MINFFPNAGTGTKITAKLKAKVFSFGDVLVDRNKMTFYQISEPLQSTSSATAADPAPYGTDINGKPLNDPIPIPRSIPPMVRSSPLRQPAPPHCWISGQSPSRKSANPFLAKLSAPNKIKAGKTLTYTLTIKNESEYPLNGTQVRLCLPQSVTFAGTPGTATVYGDEVVLTVGRVAAGSEQTIEIPVAVSPEARGFFPLQSSAIVTSATALPIKNQRSLHQHRSLANGQRISKRRPLDHASRSQKLLDASLF